MVLSNVLNCRKTNINILNLSPMETEKIKSQNSSARAYTPPLLEIIDVCIEQGFATSYSKNENWNDTPGGGNF